MIKVIPNVLTPEECAKIIKRGLWLSNLSSFFDNKDHGIRRTFVHPLIRGILKKLEPHFPEGEYSAELVRYNTGITNPEHVDYQGHFLVGMFRKKIVYWKYTGIILLNTDYDGGVLYFPKQRKAFDKRSLGTLITFPAGVQDYQYSHGVTTVTSGTRYTLVLRFV